MTALRVAALCAGYGGLESALEWALGARVVVFAEKDPFAAAVFAAHHPHTSNLGDISALSAVDWQHLGEALAPDVVAAGFRARTSATPEGGWGSVGSARVSGSTSLRLFASFDRVSSSWRTWRRSAPAGWTSSPRTWPRSGMTRGGHVYELVTPKSAPRTRATAGSPSRIPLLKTPTSQLGVNGGPQHPDKRKAGGHGPTLEDEVVFLLPTEPWQERPG